MKRLRHLMAGVRPRPHWLLALALAAAIVFVGQPATNTEAQATRTWVSGVGDDANPCSRTAPCKTFAGAISKTAALGEINCIDPGGFGAVTITKSITIDCTSTEAGVLVSGTNGIIVQVNNTDVVTLRGLDINGLKTGLSGILFNGSGTLFVENCVIYEFSQEGIRATPRDVSKIFIKDTLVRNNGLGGIHIFHPVTSSASADLDNVRIEHNASGSGTGFGAMFESNVFGEVRNSTAVDNGDVGFLAKVTNAGQSAGLKMTNSMATDHVALSTSAGVRADGNSANWVLDNNFITNNFIAMSAVNGGSIFSFGNNHSFGNIANNGTAQQVPPQ